MTKLAEFIKEHEVEINENNFTEVYEDAGIPSLIGELTEIFLAAGIAPLAYMQAVPNYYLYKSKVTSVVIPNTIKSIGNAAFEDCAGLTSVTIGNGVTSIGYYAFTYCQSLTSITIPDSVTHINSEAFYGCTALKSVEIPSTVMHIGVHVFADCKNLKDIIFKGTTERWREIEKATKGSLGIAKGTKIVCKDGEIIK